MPIGIDPYLDPLQETAYEMRYVPGPYQNRSDWKRTSTPLPSSNSPDWQSPIEDYQFNYDETFGGVVPLQNAEEVPDFYVRPPFPLPDSPPQQLNP